MNEQNKKMQLLGVTSMPRALLTLGLPSMVGMLINALYNLVDTYFVGGLGTNQMGAVTVAFPLGQIVVGLGLLFGNGAAAYLSRLLGKGDRETAQKVASTALYSSLCIGVITIIISLIFMPSILRHLGAVDVILSDALTYSYIYIGFSIFNIFNVTMNNIVSSEGATKIAMYALLCGAIFNIILDPLLIYGLHFGVAGAAIATAISQIISFSIYLIYILRKQSVFSFHLKEYCMRNGIMAEILKIGIPTLLFQILTSASIAMINKAATVYGTSALAAMGPVTKIITVGTLIVFGFLKGFQPIAGFSYGAHNYTRLKESIKIALLMSTGFCIVFSLIAFLFAPNIVSLFTKNDFDMIRIGTLALRTNSVSFVFFGFYTVYSFLFLVMGKAKEGCFLGACRQGICFLPIILLFPYLFGLNGIVFSQPAADILSVCITVIMAIKLHRQLATQ